VSFKDIKGQDKALFFLKGAIKSGKVAHAYLFIGPEGVGKRLAALNFAKALNCPRNTVDSSCDECVSCSKMDSGNHPDLFLLKPEKEGASIKIDSVRELTRSINLKPYEARKKVYIIDGAESMGHEAQNAILKTLEEPPPESVLILIARDGHGLFSTVTSRTQPVIFFPLRREEIKAILMQKYKRSAPDAELLASVSSGSMAKALKYEDEDFSETRSRILKCLAEKTLFDSDFDRVSKADLRLYLDVMLTWYRDILVVKAASAGSPALLNPDSSEAIGIEAKRMDFGQLHFIIKNIISTTSYMEQNVNTKLAMAALGATICTK